VAPEVSGGGRPGRRLDGVRAAAARRRGWFGLAAGVVAGAAAGVLAATVLPALLPSGLEPGALVILSGADDSANGQRQTLVDQWNALHPDNPASIEELPEQADAQHSEMVARAQSGTDPVDIYNLDVTSVAEFADAGYLRQMHETDADTAGFLRPPLNTCRYDGKLWALPFNSDAGLLFYRKDLVPTPPKTWADMTGDITGVLGPGGARHDPALVAGYAGQLGDYEGLTVNAMEAIWAAGGDVVDEQDHNKVVINSRQAVTGLRRLAEGLRRPADTPPGPQLILRDPTGLDETSSTEAFLEGKVMFLRMWPVAYRKLQAPGAEASGGAAAPSGAAPLPFDVTRLPGTDDRADPGPSVLGGQDLAIASTSRHPRAAAALIEFLTSERSQQILFERGGFAATREVVYHDKAVTDEYPYASVLLTAIQQARLRPATPHYARFSQVLRDVVGYALQHDGQLPGNATADLTRALRGY
jgi:multiple sugar transport system substrate-binding protein